jgi:pantoate--beta-alanine ligase
VIDIVQPREMLAWSRERHRAGRRVGFVPTMGFLHEGHLRLLDQARRGADDLVVSVFVNPLQFGPQEDLARYPRDLARDRDLVRDRGAACVFIPDERGMYPVPPATQVVPGDLGRHLCGPWRPGHFEGVLTVVAKLFHLVEPDVAVFGRKDAQQAVMVQRMVQDLNFPVDVVVAPTVREPDGLAMSSRNAYLSPEQRRVAPVLSRGLAAAHAAFLDGVTVAADLIATVRAAVEREALVRLQYVEAVDPVSLAPVDAVRGDTLLALAAHLGTTRLIDNVVLGDGLAGDDLVGAAG